MEQQELFIEIQSRALKGIKKTRATHQKKAAALVTSNLVRYIGHQVIDKTYKPSRYSCFVVLHPKPREIFSPSYSDRIVHHLLVDKMEPLTDKKLIFDSYANRKTKGTHTAVNRLRYFMQKKNTEYYLQADIASFFPSIDKNVLFQIFNKQLKTLVSDESVSVSEAQRLTMIATRVIFQDVTKPPPIFTGNQHLLKILPKHKSLFHQPKDKGLPIGSLTSQYFANLYLNELDQFVKHKLRAKYYLRYVDDFIILHDCPRQLNQWKEDINQFLKEKLRLSLHPKKIQLQRTCHGIDFLGYVTYRDHTKVRSRTVRSFKRRLYFFNHLIDPISYPIRDVPGENRLGKAYIKGHIKAPIELKPSVLSIMLGSINTYYGVLNLAESKNLRKDIFENNFGILKKYFEPKNKDWEVIKFKDDLPFTFWQSEF